MTIPDVPIGILTLIGILAGSLLAWRVVSTARIERATTERVQQAEKRVNEAPETSKYAWDLARITLESYFDRNLRQVSAIFWLSVVVMLIGVGIILWGITIAVQAQETRLPAIITGASGVITELIGATFLVLYRSTMQQAGDYTRTLERINSVGMAMQVLDTMPAGDVVDSAKNRTKAELVMVLVTQSYELTKPRLGPASRKPLATKGKSQTVAEK
jgi:nitrate reductase gamma subunit